MPSLPALPSLLGLGFAAPWVLGLLVFLPLLWRLLRVTPPRPRLVRFPALSLLLGLGTHRREAEATPPWLLALRLLIAALLIIAASGPGLMPPGAARGPGPLLLVMDDGWAAARDWEQRRAHADALLAEAERGGRGVLLLGTAPPEDNGALALSPLMPASEARARIAAWEPKPWPADRRAALAALEAAPPAGTGRVVWINDGLADAGDAALARRLQGLGGGLELVGGRSGRRLLPGVDGGPPDRLSVRAARLPAPETEGVALRVLDARGNLLARAEGRFEPDRAETELVAELPPAIRNRAARLEIEGERSAAATLLLDDGHKRRRVALAGGSPETAPLLDRLYYVGRALAPHADMARGDLADLADGDWDALILADHPLTAGPAALSVAAKVERGAVLIRFAGPLLAQGAAGDPLLPVRLLSGGRALGGVLSWTEPMNLAPFPDGSPFLGLPVPEDVEIRSQVLAEPGLDLAARTWAALTDGTPLVTAERRGRGLVVLIHTGANAEWSTLPLSGLFVDMLRRLVALSGGAAIAGHETTLSPADMLDGRGRLHPAAGVIAPLERSALGTVRPGPRHPPGLYGPPEARIAVNLGPALVPPSPFVPPPGARLSHLGEAPTEQDFAPLFAAAALALLLLDQLAALALRGLLRRGAAAALLLLPIAAGGRAEAAGPSALEAALTTRLACIATGEAAMDRLCLSGLRGLSAKLLERSTADLGEPMLVEPERDPVVFFPLLYWRLTPHTPPLSPQAADKLNAYMARGGMIVLDTGDEGQTGAEFNPAHLRDGLAGLALPPLVPMPPDHVLNRSFYLLKGAPGRWDGPILWLSRDVDSGNDGVSPVVLGGNDWIAAWAVDERGRPLHALVPGGERQREMALRFGINLVMYALTGNYKADQVHAPAILDRLKR